MNLVAISLGTARQRQIEADIAKALELGWTVDLVVTKTAPWVDVPAEVTIHPVGDRESRHVLLRTERFLVLRAPRLVYEFVRRILSVLERVTPGRIGRRVRRAQGWWKRRWIVTREGTARFHKERWGLLYANVRPFVLWRTARRHVLAGLHAPDLVVVGDGLSSPVGWHLIRRYPAAGVGFSLAEAEEDRARARQGRRRGTRRSYPLLGFRRRPATR
jgi:hypothetical protein